MKRVQSVWITGCLLLALLLTACSASPTNSSSVAPATGTTAAISTPTPVPGEAGCRPASPSSRTSFSMPQVQGRVPGGELWALIFNAWPIRARQANKIAWRMTGEGELHLVAYGPGGRTVQPADFIPHSGSNWQQPGSEWGSTFTFPAPGCWDVRATRDTIAGDVWFLVQ